MSTTISNVIRATASKFGTFRYAYVGYLTHVPDGHGDFLAVADPHWHVRFGWYGGERSAFSFRTRDKALAFARSYIIGNDTTPA
jgi:hypothetical protein